MEKNVGNTDRIIRIVLGIIFVGLAIYFGSLGQTVTAVVLGIVSLIAFGTAAMGTCLLYSVFGINTCPVKSRNN